jgi:hypothetical protein
VIRHVVLFRLVEGVDRELMATRISSLAEAPGPDGTPYILSIESGEQLSLERAGAGLDLGFIFTFASVQDRDYYVDVDPMHDAFKAWVGPLVEKAIVFDFAV